MKRIRGAKSRESNGNRKGFYINGPDFFFVPNKFWLLKELRAGEAQIESIDGRLSLTIGREFLVPAIREPAEVAYTIIPKPFHFVLSIPNSPLSEIPSDLRRYIELTSQFLSGAIPAKDYVASGTFWYSHMRNALKNPFGSIAIPRKFRPYQRGVSAHYLPGNEGRGQAVAVPMTFYTRCTPDPTSNRAIVAFLNSSPSLALRYRDRSWLGAASEEMNGVQLDQMPILDPTTITKADVRRLSTQDLFMHDALPDLSEQIRDPTYSEIGREALDSAVLQILGFEGRHLERIRQGCIEILGRWIQGIEGVAT